MLHQVKQIAENCPCGTKHTLLTDTAEVSMTATASLIDFLTHYQNPLFICDTNTEKYLTDITPKIKNAAVLTLAGNSHADENGVAPVADKLTGGHYDILIACGSGSVHDITRYSADKAKLPFLSYPTAASVDGFVSTVAAMTWKGQKLSSPAAAPIALFADVNVIDDAPERLTASGVSDILGKFTALNDWKIARILTGETICPEIYGLMEKAMSQLTALLEKKAVTPAAFDRRSYTKLVTEALVLAGLSMQLQGNSRPASGSEHHLSHLWEMHVINRPTDALHGEQVGVASLLLSKFYHEHEGFDFTRKIDVRAVFDRERLLPIFGSLTDGILAENLNGGMPLCYTATASASHDANNAIAHLIMPDTLKRYLSIAGSPMTLSELSLPDNEAFIEKTLMYAPFVRKRLTLLKILSAG